MVNLAEARARYKEAREKVSRHQMYEGRSTRSGSEVYLDAYEAAVYYIYALEGQRAVHENANEKEDNGYHLHTFTGHHAAVAKMISDYCDLYNVRVHTFIHESERTYSVLFERED